MRKGQKTTKSDYPTSLYKTKLVGGVRHMICQNSEPGGKYFKGEICENYEKVGHEAVAVLCSQCCLKLSDPVPVKTQHVKSDKPKGWRFMKVFVDKDGNVYHKGVEQTSLKGTLPVTVIEPKPDKPEKKKLSKKDKEERISQLGKEIGEIKAKLMSEIRKTKRYELTRDLNKRNRELKKLV